MTLGIFSILMILGTVLSAVSFLIILFYIDPMQAGGLGILLFYAALILSLLGIIHLVGFFLRLKLFRRNNIFYTLSTALRQAIFFTILIVGTLFLQSQKILNWWNIILFVLALTVLEFFFVAKREGAER